MCEMIAILAVELTKHPNVIRVWAKSQLKFWQGWIIAYCNTQ